jgi:epoxyqueuosine reductase QueG/putative sterol carrier protein
MVRNGESFQPVPDSSSITSPKQLKATDLRLICLDAGADDVGFVDIGRSALDPERKDILTAYPRTRTIICLVIRLNAENIRSQARHIASDEIHHATDTVATIGRTILRRLNALGVRGSIEPADFPMDMGRFPGKMWNVSHKIMAVESGLGHMGLNRLVIHPQFGNFIRMTSLLVDAELDVYGSPLDHSLCDRCGLCISVCPVGAIHRKAPFDFIACMTHSYRDNFSGFMDMLDSLLRSPSMDSFRQRFTDRETASMWQSLMYKMNYKCGYCMAVCPAGQAGHFCGSSNDFLQEVPLPLKDKKNQVTNKKEIIENVVKPLQQRAETVYVIPGSDAECNARHKVPHKTIKSVSNNIRPSSVANFLASMQLAFQRHQSEGLSATYHFSFSGSEQVEATIFIKDNSISIERGHAGVPDVQIHADAKTWLRVLHKESSMLKEIILRRIRVKGPMKLFKAFGKCFV